MKTLSSIERVKPKLLFDSGHLKMMDINDWHFIDEQSMVICIPYFQEQNKILLRYEEIPPFTYKYPHIDKFITVMSETMEPGETPEQTLIRGLKEEFGIELVNSVKPEIMNPIFSNKGCTAQYNICILPLMNLDYTLNTPTTDGSAFEKRAKSVEVHLSELNNVVLYDLVSKYALDMFKKHYSLF